MIKSSIPVPLDTVRVHTTQILDALSYLHDKAVTHKDLRVRTVVFKSVWESNCNYMHMTKKKPLLPPAYEVPREGNVFSLSVHGRGRGLPPSPVSGPTSGPVSGSVRYASCGHAEGLSYIYCCSWVVCCWMTVDGWSSVTTAWGSGYMTCVPPWSPGLPLEFASRETPSRTSAEEARRLTSSGWYVHGKIWLWVHFKKRFCEVGKNEKKNHV